jgi:hypothetical protein
MAMAQYRGMERPALFFAVHSSVVPPSTEIFWPLMSVSRSSNRSPGIMNLARTRPTNRGCVFHRNADYATLRRHSGKFLLKKEVYRVVV